jgi:hypothetical protein
MPDAAPILLPPVSAATLAGHYADDLQILVELRRYDAVQRGSEPFNAPTAPHLLPHRLTPVWTATER